MPDHVEIKLNDFVDDQTVDLAEICSAGSFNAIRSTSVRNLVEIHF